MNEKNIFYYYFIKQYIRLSIMYLNVELTQCEERLMNMSGKVLTSFNVLIVQREFYRIWQLVSLGKSPPVVKTVTAI